MFKTFFFLFIFSPLFLFSQYADTSSENYKAYYYQEGILSSEGLMIDGKPNGYWITYYPSQLRKSEGNRKDFLLDSIWKFYDKKGNIENLITYKNDKKNGPYLYYNDQCIVIKEENYENDILNGLQLEYYSDTLPKEQRIKKQINYVNGKESGVGFEYGKDGRIITVITYKKGFLVSSEKINRTDKKNNKIGVWKEYFENGRLKREERYKNGLLNGYVKNYNAQGKLEGAVLYINGVEQNKEDNMADFNIETSYYASGAVKSNVTLNLAGKKDGISTFLDEDGNITASQLYRNGYLLESGIIDKEGLYQGMWETFYLDGTIKSKGKYKDGKKFGKWEYYFSNGAVEQKGFYDDNGEFTGEWQWFYEDGSLLRKEEFRRGLEDGYLEEYSRNGEIITKGEYFDGEKEGQWIYKLNDHKEEGKYRYGQRNGLWEERFANGKLSFEGTYVDGVPEGKHKYYNQNGVLIKEENYSYGKRDGKWKWFDSFGMEIMTMTYDEGKEKKINGQRVKFIEE